MVTGNLRATSRPLEVMVQKQGMRARVSFVSALAVFSLLASSCSTNDMGKPAKRGTGAAGGSDTGGSSGASGSSAAGGSQLTGGSGALGGSAGSEAGSSAIAGTSAAGYSGAGSRGGTGGMSALGGSAGRASNGGATAGGAAGAGGMGGGGVSRGGATGAGGGGSGGAPTNQCTGTASATAANKLTVNVDAAENLIGDGIFGLLMERLGKNWSGGLFVGTSSSIPNTDGMRNDVIQAFKDAGVGAIEWPGGCAANGYDWSSNKTPNNDVGTDRYMELTTLLGIPPLIAGPGTSAAAAQNLAWVQYINQNPAHADWALNQFKIGNEVWGCGGNQTESAYETNYLANYEQLSAPVGGKKLKLIAGTGLIGNWTWLDAMLKDIGDKIDGIELHDYVYHPSDIKNVGFSDDDYYNVVDAANQGQIGPRIEQAVAYLDKYDPAKRIKIWEDEWGDWLEPFSSSDGWLQQGTVMDAISAAESLHLFMQHADRYAMAGLAQGVNVIHSLVLTRGSDAAMVRTPTWHVFKLFLPHHRANAKWAPNTLESEKLTVHGKTLPVVSAGSTVDEQGRVNVSLVNVDLTATHDVELTIDGGAADYVVSTAEVVTGPAKDSYNDYGQPEVVGIQPLAGSSCSSSGKTVTVRLPSKSVVMLGLTPAGSP